MLDTLKEYIEDQIEDIKSVNTEGFAISTNYKNGVLSGLQDVLRKIKELELGDKYS